MKPLKNKRLNDLVLMFCLGAAFFVPRAVIGAEPEASDAQPSSFQVQDGLLWTVVLGQAALYALDVWDLMPIGAPLIGPTFDPAKPDPELLLSPQLDATIGLPHREDSVPTSALVYTAMGTLAGLNGLVALSPARQDWRQYHQVSLGLSAALFTTISATEVLKRSVGRLRPDFRERFIARGCQGALNVEAAQLPCDSVNPDLSEISEEDYNYGRRSFPSGHSSTAFALGTFTALYLYQLGHNIQEDHHAAAYASWGGALGALGLASFVAASRIADNRHHLEDVITGSLIGSGIAAASYFFVTAPVFESKPGITMGFHPVAGGTGGLSFGGKW